jgi:hypothetical protein
LTGAPFPELISGLAFSPNGTLYAINTNFSQPALTNLVTIDPITGRIEDIGPLPNDTDAISFGPAREPNDWTVSVVELRFPFMVLLFVFAMGVFFWAMRSERR